MEAWPALPLRAWNDTYQSVHRWMQILGKTRLQFSPPQNHWWHTALYVTTRGIATSPMPNGDNEFDVELDFIDHTLDVRASDGRHATIELVQRSVADFYHEYLAALDTVGAHLDIFPQPMELPDTLRFDEDTTHGAYEPAAMHDCWRVLAAADRVLKIFRGRFIGKSSPSHFWWGSFDLACTRFSGKRAPPHPGGAVHCPDYVTREAYSRECMSVGWWPGNLGGFEDAAFYAYAYPEPQGCSTAPLAPPGAFYHDQMREWILPYEVVRLAANPEATLLEFCETTYAIAADLGHWDRNSLERP